MYVACLRNYCALVRHLATHHSQVAVIGAGARGQFREEDELCCAWIAQGLAEAGFELANGRTGAAIDRWRGALPEVIAGGASAEYLRRTGQQRDLDFILNHHNDLVAVHRFERGEVRQVTVLRPA